MKQKLRSHYLIVQQTLAELNYDAYLTHCRWMEYAIALAQMAGDAGEIPVAAIIVAPEGNLIAEATNHKERSQDATAHAEILAIRAASQVKQSCYLQNFTLYVTLEPCPMCAGAIINSRVGLLVYGADEPKTGAIRTITNLPDSYCSNHRLKVLAGIKQELCRQQLQTWFINQRSALEQDLNK
jgi:tRNA(adenine34) deaminase